MVLPNFQRILSCEHYDAHFVNEIKGVQRGKKHTKLEVICLLGLFHPAAFDALHLLKDMLSLLAQPFHILVTLVELDSCRIFFMGVTQGILPLKAPVDWDDVRWVILIMYFFPLRSLLRVDNLTHIENLKGRYYGAP